MDARVPAAAPIAYWAEACDHLMRRDRILRRLIPACPEVSLCLRGNPFQTLARIIVGQQMSLALGRGVWGRLAAACDGTPHPERVVQLDLAVLRTLGLSQRKAEYLHAAAHHFRVAERMQVAWWQALDDAAVLAQLCSIRGVGRWSAEMFLIFCLGRPDVLPLDDRALLKAISHHYFSGEPVSRFEAREVAQAWSPWCTVASWYLWRSMNAASVDY